MCTDVSRVAPYLVNKHNYAPSFPLTPLLCSPVHLYDLEDFQGYQSVWRKSAQPCLHEAHEAAVMILPLQPGQRSLTRDLIPENEIWLNQHWDIVRLKIVINTDVKYWNIHGKCSLWSNWNNAECRINSDNESTFIQLWYDQNWENAELNQHWFIYIYALHYTLKQGYF